FSRFGPAPKETVGLAMFDFQKFLAQPSRNDVVDEHSRLLPIGDHTKRFAFPSQFIFRQTDSIDERQPRPSLQLHQRPDPRLFTSVIFIKAILDKIFAYSCGSRARTFWSLNLTLTLFQFTAGFVRIIPEDRQYFKKFLTFSCRERRAG